MAVGLNLLHNPFFESIISPVLMDQSEVPTIELQGIQLHLSSLCLNPIKTYPA